MLPRLTGVREISIAHVVLTSGLGCYDFHSSVLAETTVHHADFEGLDDSASNYAQAFKALLSDLKRLEDRREIVSAVQCLNATISSVELTRPSNTNIAISHQINGRAFVLDARQESEGFRRFLAHLLALYQSPSKQTMVFEEPEKGLHPGALATLAEELQACPDAGRGQVILTTHSPDLLDQFAPESIRVVEMENYVTKIGPLEDGQLSALKEQLLKPGELLTVDPARMQSSDAAPT